ncbi:MAG: tRNA (N6-isopentenyl adenosine(37)-C2)-methylthiotransferase MiaB [Firmicutes bacterium]|nr:tRNA (N6-isopentenyl adenosine(37)-C2)-methylthiotransferase MiaB [Bacillota bacterium]
MNEHDSEVIAALLESMNYCHTPSPEEADLIVINTCAVRQKPEDKVSSLLGKYQELKKEKPDLMIAVTGCMTQQEELAAYIRDRFHHVDLILGTHALPRLPSLIAMITEHKGRIVDIEEDYPDREGLPISHSSSFKAWLPVIYGCNNYCSYCVVPYVRGRERSRSLRDILNEASDLGAKGFIEVTLLGQNVNSYGQDLAENVDFPDLLMALNDKSGLKRIRFMTSHPKDLSDRLIEAVKNGDQICEHFHLPVQSGSNRILEKMNRSYTREKYMELINKIRASIPGVAITSDLIVGFPGEEESDFLDTLSLVEEARFDNAFSFLYSPRKNTAAAMLSDQLSAMVKNDRLKRLNEIQHRISKEMNHNLLNKVVEVLVDGPSKSDPAFQTGRTRTNKLVHLSADVDLSGKVIAVRITEAKTWNLHGELAEGIK